MSVNDNIRKALESHGGFSINERVYNYLGSLGYTGALNDRLAKHKEGGFEGWRALVFEHGALPTGPDYSTAQVGDEIGGGLYIGTITYADSRQFHLIVSKVAGELLTVPWSDETVVTGITDKDDGKANTDAIKSGFDIALYPAADHCDSYTIDGYEDWYLPAENELKVLQANLRSTMQSETYYYWTSAESSSANAWMVRSDIGDAGTQGKTNTFIKAARPMRRVAV